MSLFQPIAVASRPGTTRFDYFAIAPNSNGAGHVPHWLGPGSGAAAGDPHALFSWQELGGDGSSLDAVWAGDGSQLVLFLLGDDARFWTNALDPVTNTWSGWRSNPDGSLHALVLATS